jgi:hypothetical protein
MSVDLNAIREALAAQLQARIPWLHVYAFDPGAVQYPCAVVYPGSDRDGDYVGYQQTFGARGLAGIAMSIEVRIAAADPVSAQRTMGTLLSTGVDGSVHDALMAPTATDGAALSLSGAVDNMFLPSVSPPVFRTADGVVELAATFRLMIRESR